MNSDTLLHRQVHPSFVQNGKVTSQAFRPTPKDHGGLSVYDGDKITAEAAWEHYTTTLQLMSNGVLSLSLQEIETNNLTAKADAEKFPEHVLIDFTKLPSNEVPKIAKLLKIYAEKRGWQFQAA